MTAQDEKLKAVRARANELLAIKGMSHLRMVDGMMGALGSSRVASEGIDVTSSLEEDGTITVQIVSKTTLYSLAPDDGEIDF